MMTTAYSQPVAPDWRLQCPECGCTCSDIEWPELDYPSVFCGQPGCDVLYSWVDNEHGAYKYVLTWNASKLVHDAS